MADHQDHHPPPADPDLAGGDDHDHGQNQQEFSNAGAGGYSHGHGQGHGQGQEPHEQRLRLRRLSHTTPAAPFVSTPAGAPASSFPLGSSSAPFDSNGTFDLIQGQGRQDEGKLPPPAHHHHHQLSVPADANSYNAHAGPGGAAGGHNRNSNHRGTAAIAVDSHLGLDDVRGLRVRPPWRNHRNHHPSGISTSSEAASAAVAATSGSAAASGSAPASAAAAAARPSWAAAAHPAQQSPSPQQPQQSPQRQQHAGINPTPPRTRSSALLSAKYYAAATLAKIPPNLADRAVKSAHGAFKVSASTTVVVAVVWALLS